MEPSSNSRERGNSHLTRTGRVNSAARDLLRLLLFLLPVLSTKLSFAEAPASLSTSRFGTISITKPSADLRGVVIFFTDSDKKAPVANRIRETANEEGFLVAEIDSSYYLAQLKADNQPCAYFSGELERLSQVIQNSLKLPRYREPILVGVGAGGAIVYTALAESSAPFTAAASIDFCPELPLSEPLCPESEPRSEKLDNERISLSTAPSLDAPWTVVTAKSNPRCPKFIPEEFVAAAKQGALELYQANDNSLDQIEASVRDAFRSFPPASSAIDNANPLTDLPFVELPAASGDTLAIFVSGDGGWASFDSEVAERLVDHGVSVVGFNSLRYFWRKKSPAEFGTALTRAIENYLLLWQKKRVLLVGFSFGADVLPFGVNSLPDTVRKKVAAVVLLSPSVQTNFEIQLTDWLGVAEDSSGPAVLPEIERMRIPKLCIYGSNDSDAVCPKLPREIITQLPGSHHFDGDYDRVAELILSRLSPP